MSLRLLARVCVVLFAVSTAFPIVAGILHLAQPPRWLGVGDVVVAAALFIAVATLTARAKNVVTDRHRIAASRLSQVVLGAIPVLIAAYFVVGPRIDWTVLTLGLAWRGWLLLYTLPFLVAASAADSHA
jgi:hypothetical protein